LEGFIGKGKTAYHSGTATWPEENFILVTYVDDAIAATASLTVERVKQKFKGEGIKMFTTAVSEMPQIEMLPKVMDASFRKCYQG
jgi:hypothetical protein